MADKSNEEEAKFINLGGRLAFLHSRRDMLGISYGELFLIIGATAALVGEGFPPFGFGFPLIFEGIDSFCLGIICRPQGSSYNCKSSRKVGWSGNWLCPVGSRPIRQCHATVSSSPGFWFRSNLYIYIIIRTRDPMNPHRQNSCVYFVSQIEKIVLNNENLGELL